MSKELYQVIWMMINQKIEQAKKIEKSFLDSLIDTPENDYTYNDCIKHIKQAHIDIAQYTELLEKFEDEVEEPK